MKVLMCVTMLALLSLLNVNIVGAQTKPLLIHEYNEVNVFDACSYYKITDFTELEEFTKETIRTDSKNEVVGNTKNGIWEYEYLDPYIASVPDKLIPYVEEECVEDNKTAQLLCNNVTLYNQTYKNETRYNSVWMVAEKLLNEPSKLSDIRIKPTQNVRYCADIERVWTDEGFTIRVDTIPYFDGVIYDKYIWWDTSMTRWALTQLNTEADPFLVNDTVAMTIGGGKQCIWANAVPIPTFAYNDTAGIIYITDDNVQLPSFVDEGNGSDFGTPDGDIILWLPLHCEGTNCDDMSIYNHNGTKDGATDPTDIQSVICEGQQFDGTEKILVGDQAIYDGMGELTLMANINLTDSTALRAIVSKWDGSLNFDVISWWLFVTSDNRVNFQIGKTPPPAAICSFATTNAVIVDNQYHHVAATYNGSHCTIYVDGNVEGTSAGSGTITASARDVKIGADSLGAGFRFYWIGEIDNVMIFNRSLTANEITAYQNNTHDDGYSIVGPMEIFVPPPPPPPPPIHSFIIFKLINTPIPFIGWFFDIFTYKAVILFMDRLTVTGNVDIGGNISGNQFYGEMWFHNDLLNSTTVISAQMVWVKVEGFDDGESNNQTLNGFSYTNGTLIANVAGKYDSEYSASYGNVGNNQEYQLALAINNTIQNQTETHRKIGAAGDVGNAGSSGFIDLAVDDEITLMVRNNDGTGDMLTHAANVNLIRIGD